MDLQIIAEWLVKRELHSSETYQAIEGLTRYRKKINDNIASEKNRLQRYLEDANVKLSSVATDVFGVSGRAMLKAILEGATDPDALSKLAVGRLKSKGEELKESFNGRITEHHRMLVDMSLRHIEYMEELIVEIDGKIRAMVGKHSLGEAVTLLDSIPGVNETAAEAIIAETGTDMGMFPSAEHLASWAGVSPGSNESAGKKKGEDDTWR